SCSPTRHRARWCRVPKRARSPSIDPNSITLLMISPPLAVLRLTANSNLIDWMTGRSAGFSPLTIRPVYTPAWHRPLTAYQIGCEVGQSVVLVLRPAVLNRHILALDEPAFLQALVESGDERCECIWRS